MKYKKIIFFFLDIFAVVFAFLFVTYLKPATLTNYIPAYKEKFFYFLLIWTFISIISNKNALAIEKNFNSGLRIYFISNLLILAITTTFIISFHIIKYSRLILLGTIFLSFILEFILYIIFYLINKITKVDVYTEIFKDSYEESNNALQKSELLDLKNLLDNAKQISDLNKTAYNLFNEKDFFGNINLKNWIFSALPLEKIGKKETLVFNTGVIENLRNYDNGTIKLFINLKKINNIKNINKFFIQVHSILKEHGIYIGCFQTNKEKYKFFKREYPFIISNILYTFHFIFHRIFPKLPITKQIYFLLTKGINRALSKAEVLGRLYFCGYEVYDVKEIGGTFFFISIKFNEPKNDKNPSYGPLIKLRRVGKNKEIIYIYKFRTMHPYSEYLQEYMYKNNQLEDSGKFKDDFRVTSWGRVFRKMWIDELPQIINLLRGDINLVGVRALSEHYFNLYPKELQDLRTKFHPGLIPPYYVDLPKSFEEILESERKYLYKKLKHPFLTDMEYFFRALYNIIFKHARSK